MANAQSMLLELDVRQGYNFDKTVQLPCGFVTKLKVGDKQFSPDQDVKDILEGKSLKVVGVLRQLEWDTSITGPVGLLFQVSTACKQGFSLLKLKEMTKNQVEFEVVVFDFDSVKQQFHKSFHTQDTMMKGVVQKENGNFVLDVKNTPSKEVAQPENFLVQLGVNPTGEQVFHLAASVDGKVTKQWGMNT